MMKIKVVVLLERKYAIWIDRSILASLVFLSSRLNEPSKLQ
jgi:hypothetical protein